MKKTRVMILMLAAAFLISQGMAFAKEVSGKVTGVDALTQTLKLSAKDEAKGAAEELSIKVNDKTQYSGIAAFAELKEGAAVSVEAEQDAATGNWVASSVKASEEAAKA